MIRVACPHCGRTFRTMTEGMGRTAVCTGCGDSFRIGEARPKFEWKNRVLAEESWVGVEAPKEKQEVRHCIMCQAVLDDDAVRCPACGANQVTGLVQRAPVKVVEPKRRLRDVLPWNWIAGAAVVLVVVVVIVGGVKMIFRSAEETGQEIVNQRITMEAGRFQDTSGDPGEFARRYGNQVTDENLSRYVLALQAGDPVVRRGGARLIAAGQVRKLGPVVDLAGQSGAQGAEAALEALRGIGPVRLVELSNEADEQIRVPAAKGLALISGLGPDAAAAKRLAQPMATAEKVKLLNSMTRPYPAAAGTFAILIEGRQHTAPAQVEQYGRLFVLRIGQSEFWSDPHEERVFTIPVEQWCSATASGLSPREARNYVSGMVKLASPFGAGWEGTAAVAAREPLEDGPPGFLPTGKMKVGQRSTLEVKLSK